MFGILMREDTNTRGYFYWFNFKVSGMQRGKTYTFLILNMQKRFSLYENGMSPCVYSEKRYLLKKIKWTKTDCTGIKYKNNSYFKRKNGRKLYTL